MKPGAGKATVGASFLTAGNVSDAKGDKRSYGMTETGLSTYGEAGLARRLSVGWAWAFLKFVESDSGDRTGVTGPEISLTWHIGKAGGAVFALQGLTQWPWGPGNPGAVPDFAPAFHSHGAYAFELRPLVGHARARWWSQAGAGVRARTEDLAWQFRYAAAAGRAFGPRWSGMLALDGVTPLDTETSGKAGDQEQYFGSHRGRVPRFAALAVGRTVRQHILPGPGDAPRPAHQRLRPSRMEMTIARRGQAGHPERPERPEHFPRGGRSQDSGRSSR